MCLDRLNMGIDMVLGGMVGTGTVVRDVTSLFCVFTVEGPIGKICCGSDIRLRIDTDSWVSFCPCRSLLLKNQQVGVGAGEVYSGWVPCWDLHQGPSLR